MKAKAIINIITGKGTEQDILNQLKKALAKTNLPSHLSHNKLTPLIAAAMRGYTHILRYLIEEKKLNPVHTQDDAVLLLKECLSQRQVDSARYLINLLKNLDNLHLNKILRAAVVHKQLPIVNVLLDTWPQLINYNTVILLEQALVSKVDEITITLLQRGAHQMVFIPSAQGICFYSLVLDDANEKVLRALLELNVSPVRSLLTTSNLPPLLALSFSSESATKQRLCASLLLEAGAGVNISWVPDEILALYGLSRSNPSLETFLIVGEQQADGTWKKRSIYKMAELEKALCDPHWRFKIAQLKQAAVEMNVPELISLFATLPDVAALTEAAPLPQIISPNIRSSSVTPLESALYQTWGVYSTNKKRLMQILENKATEKNIVKDFFKSCSALINFLHHDIANRITLDKNYTILSALREDITFIESSLFSLIKSDDDDDENYITSHSFIMTNLFNDQLNSMLHLHKALLSKPQYTALYIHLMQINAKASTLIAMDYLKLNRSHLTLHYAIHAIKQLDKCLAIDIQRGRSSVEYDVKLVNDVRHKTLFILIAAYIKQGCIQDALKCLQEATNNYYHMPDYIADMHPIILNSLHELVSLPDSIALLNQFITYQTQSISVDLSPITFSKYQQLITLRDQYEQYEIELFSAIISIKMRPFGKVILDRERESLRCILSDSLLERVDLQVLNQYDNPQLITYDAHSHEIHFMKAFLLSNQRDKQLRQLIASLSPKESKAAPSTQAADTEMLCKKLSEVTIELKKPKIKTRPPQSSQAHSESEPIQKPKTKYYGFKPLDGYSPPIAVVSDYIPEKTLFITIPNNDPTFLPFLNLAYDQKLDTYHEIRSIAEKGHNQQGAKLGSRWQKMPNQAPIKIDIARIKVLGAEGKGKLRATGSVQQEIRTKANKLRKLYVIDQVTDKKAEKRQKKF
ncbi:ankyrin repeat domain-containing protein [Candidatus Berkiella aquae]|uniref:Ankyrin repeat domain-containing protein n=1 Tax=Candidatus Berkiella aquae TaxID=295108 RepID=A0A0Q9YWS6_9GAMM|nr:ankyrin repeat domain-containing protein [Candidatus Berkiella aquae]MCS5710942.1 ankyrin repeat domain-containing protein [Candidatus Berkiella aquae]